MKFLDVSNVIDIGGQHYGPKENDIVRYLKQYAMEYGHKVVYHWEEADVVFTNDVFPDTHTREDKEPFPGKFKVKRMDGIFTHPDKVQYNELLNRAARQADHVIFISQFSAESYFRLYDPDRTSLKAWSIIRNEVDHNIFFPGHQWSDDLRVVVASCSNWSRPEKRLSELLYLAKIDPDVTFTIIGEVYHKHLPSNVRVLGYLPTPLQTAQALRDADAMVSLFYKDAHPKTMIQGVYCGLPVLHTASGGQIEIPAVGNRVTDTLINWYAFDSKEDSVPSLNLSLLENDWNQFKWEYEQNKSVAMKFRGRDRFHAMLRNYYGVFQLGM
jgi:glycosyltransferase involved in cell wall biosynthesis